MSSVDECCDTRGFINSRAANEIILKCHKLLGDKGLGHNDRPNWAVPVPGLFTVGRI